MGKKDQKEPKEGRKCRRKSDQFQIKPLAIVLQKSFSGPFEMVL